MHICAKFFLPTRIIISPSSQSMSLRNVNWRPRYISGLGIDKVLTVFPIMVIIYIRNVKRALQCLAIVQCLVEWPRCGGGGRGWGRGGIGRYIVLNDYWTMKQTNPWLILKLVNTNRYTCARYIFLIADEYRSTCLYLPVMLKVAVTVKVIQV